MTPDELQTMVDEVCKCGHARRWHGELVLAASGTKGITSGICDRGSGYANPCTCVVFRPADKTECPCCKGTGKVLK